MPTTSKTTKRAKASRPRLAAEPKNRSKARRKAHDDEASTSAAPFEQVYAMVRRIPRGRVMTYGQIASRLEGRLSARAVGWAMHGCPKDVPWHRVVNAMGRCSTDAIGEHPGLQRALLEREGVTFRGDRIDLERYRHLPR